MEVDLEAEIADNPSAASTNSNVSNYIPWETLKKYFLCSQPIEKETKNFSVVCLKCRKTISTSKSSASNLTKHLKGVHSAEHKEYTDLKGRRDASEPPSKLQKSGESRQRTISDFLVDKDRKGEYVSQKRVDDVTVDFIVNEGLPFNLVDSPYFRSCLLLGLPPNLTTMSSKKLGSRLDEDFTRMKKKLNQILADVEYVATTADCWSKFRRSYIGMTIHWIDEVSLQRRSAVLALQRIYGSHTYRVLAEKISEVHRDYNVQNKTVRTSTDNGSNFVKAFRLFSEFSDNEETEDQDEEEEIMWITDILNNPDEDENDKVTLPPHQRCASQTLSLIAVNDSKEALKDEKFNKINISAFRKLKKIWRKQNKSTLIADAIKQICGVYLKTPSPTRWNSLFDAADDILQHIQVLKDRDSKNKVFDAAGLDRLSTDDIEFLREYVAVNAPLAEGLDIVQGDKDMYLGYLLPTLKTIQATITKLKAQGLAYCLPLANAILKGLARRFDTDFKDDRTASCSHPKFQLDWLDDEEEEAAKGILLKAMIKEAEKSSSKIAATDLVSSSSSSQSSPQVESCSTVGGFFTFKQKRGAPLKPSDLAQEELRRYLSSRETDVKSLHNFPLTKMFFF